ncbi:MAG: class I SAM-dependent methyltransferase [Candidatus Aureabacteria bacterium]|nr:class I SAM-dependent methyltransferase [Candidatus Auribacterota bacterium]
MKTDRPDNREKLENIYRSHHRRGNRYGLLYCGPERVRIIKKWLGENKKVLDLGCRDGEFTKHYAGKNNVTGVDIDRDALVIAKKNLNIDTEWLDLNEEFPFREDSYDAVIACEIIEHIYYPESFLEKIRRVLKPGGVFIGSAPNAFRMYNRVKFLFGRDFDTDRTHIHIFSVPKIAKLLGQYFVVEEIVPAGGKLFPYVRVPGKAPFFIKKLFGKDIIWKAVKKK